MEATIVSVTYHEDLKYVANSRNGEEYWCGYVIELEGGGVVRVLVDNGGQCCEKWGVHMLLPGGALIEDGMFEAVDREAVKGAKVLRVAWGKLGADASVPMFVHGDQHACVDLHTDRGLIQLIAYNDHNGYYPHTVHVEWPGYTSTEEL